MENKLRELRLAKGMTQEELGFHLSTPAGQIAKLETGGRRMSDVWIDKICRTLRCTPNQLFGFDNLSKDDATLDKELMLLTISKALTFISALPKAQQKKATPEFIAEFSLSLYEIVAEQKEQGESPVIVTKMMENMIGHKLHD